jgi:hypothetical protein
MDLILGGLRVHLIDPIAKKAPLDFESPFPASVASRRGLSLQRQFDTPRGQYFIGGVKQVEHLRHADVRVLGSRGGSLMTSSNAQLSNSSTKLRIGDLQR